MKLKDLSIGTLLAIGIGIILIFVVILGFVSFIQEDKLWQETKRLYEHPLQSRRAIGDIRADLLMIHGDTKDLLLAQTNTEQEQILQDIDAAYAQVLRRIEDLYTSYTGNVSDIDDLLAGVTRWKTARDETIRLIKTGDQTGASERMGPTGLEGVHYYQTFETVEIINEFARYRADQIYQTAREQRDSLYIQLIFLLGIIILLSFSISYLLIKAIQTPLNELFSVTQRYAQGDLDARSQYYAGNEFGVLTSSFNSLADIIQADIKNREVSAYIGEMMLGEEELMPFCRRLLPALLEKTGSHLGAVYLLDKEREEFVLFHAIGLSSDARKRFSAADMEGEFGKVLATKTIQHITDIPKDTSCIYSAVSRDMLPAEIVTVPIITGEEVVAIISLANLNPYTPAAIQILNTLWLTLTARFNGVLAYQKIMEFSSRLELQNLELDKKSRELVEQGKELTAQNIELEHQRKELEEINRLKTTFLSNMSHELRTPLNSIIALSGVLSRRLHAVIPEEEFSYIEVIERNGRHLLSLINDILDLSRIESGRDEILLSRFFIHELVADIIPMIQPQAEEKNIALDIHIPNDLPQVTSDYKKCQHILQNLISNAVKFTEEGAVTITAHSSDDKIHIAVQDTGIGIAPEHISLIFDEFRQADERVARTYGGTGLGLSIAMKYIRMLHCNIEVESTPTVGSLFTLIIPLSFPKQPDMKYDSKDPERGLTKPTPFERVPTDMSKTILVVEDNEPAIIQITDLLGSQGYQIQIARNGKEALDRIREKIPDAVILDLMMPDVDGFTVLHEIRSNEKTTLLPVLILTAKHVTRDELRFLKGNHIYQLIQKGDISRDALLRAVENMVYPEEKQSGTKKNKAVPTKQTPVLLVIEDNPDNMTTIRALLSEKYWIAEAPDGRSGLVEAQKIRPDIILLDISLPGMDGYAVLDEIRNDQDLKAIPVIALTAHAMKGDRERFLSYGFDEYLSKPVDLKELDDVLRRFLYG